MGTEEVVEIGFDLGAAFQGQGYMLEALQPIIQFGFTSMCVDMIDVTVEVENDRSIRLLQKLGFESDIELRNNMLYFSLANSQGTSRE